MAHQKKNRKQLIKKIFHKYRFVILNGETFEERFTFRTSRLNVFVFFCMAIVLFVFLTLLLIAYTPLKEYIPGYSSAKLKRQAVMLTYKTDSLEKVLERNTQYFNSIQHVLLGDSLETVDQQGEQDREERVAVEEENALVRAEPELSPSKMDSILRKEVESNERYNIFNPLIKPSSVQLYPPVKGMISQAYDPEEHHYGVDISLDENSPVKATAEGVVVFAEWTVETGYVIILKHDFNLLSVYKHNITLLKRQGDYVKKGEVIALTGNTGEYTTGPHLHFELWENAHALNPQDFFDFD